MSEESVKRFVESNTDKDKKVLTKAKDRRAMQFLAIAGDVVLDEELLDDESPT